MQDSQAATGRADPPIAEALYTIIAGTLEPMAEHREFELGVAARVLNDALMLVVAEIELMPIEKPDRGKRRRRSR